MYCMKHQSQQENLIYLVLWAMLFVAPILSMYVRSVSDGSMTFQWGEIWMIWSKFALFLVLFLVHNFLLAPLLVYRRKKALYFATALCVVTAFTVFQCSTRPDDFKPGRGPHPMEMGQPEGMAAPGHERDEAFGPDGDEHFVPRHQDHRQGPPPAFIGEHDIIAVIILILMMGANLGIKVYFKNRADQKRLVQLERQNLEQQLEYLKYQLNPHFLMNTLNNIHALIDIDAVKAQEAVIQLSKILRYVLYESNKERVRMSQEVEFMENYVRLMRMRYTDQLRFSVQSPDAGTDVMVAPLVFISFVENAFKHGVSYRQESFIEVKGERYQDKGGRDRLLWTCRNSKPEAAGDEKTADLPRQGGVGMQNVRHRLDLIYGDNYSLDILDGSDTYEVRLDIPLEKSL